MTNFPQDLRELPVAGDQNTARDPMINGEGAQASNGRDEKAR